MSKHKKIAKDDGRLLALKALNQVLSHGESLSTVLPYYLHQVNDKDRALLQALVYGVLRWRWRIEAELKPYIKKPLKAKDIEVQLILMLGLFQLKWMRIPDYAVVDAAVKSAGTIKRPWAAGLVNAVLRNYLRQHEAEDSKQESSSFGSPVAEYSHPQWLIEKIKKDWPQQWRQILEQNNQQAPMTLRVNTESVSVDEYVKQLAEDEISAEKVDQVPCAVVLKSATDVTGLPGFDDGLIAVQDAAAQYAALILDVQAGDTVLDACAAPGGKTAHLLQHTNNIKLDAIDISEERLERVAENLERMQQSASLIQADISQPGDWLKPAMYDRILLDAPCSATGVIRRHPDIKSLRKPNDIAGLVNTQRQILSLVWQTLKPGGLLLYATCSVLKDENENQVAEFLNNHSGAQAVSIELPVGEARSCGVQILPGENQMDGFYYALIQKNAK